MQVTNAGARRPDSASVKRWGKKRRCGCKGNTSRVQYKPKSNQFTNLDLSIEFLYGTAVHQNTVGEIGYKVPQIYFNLMKQSLQVRVRSMSMREMESEDEGEDERREKKKGRGKERGRGGRRKVREERETNELLYLSLPE